MLENKRKKANELFREKKYENAIGSYHDILQNLLKMKNMVDNRLTNTFKNVLQRKVLYNILQNIILETSLVSMNISTTFLELKDSEKAYHYILYGYLQFDQVYSKNCSNDLENKMKKLTISQSEALNKIRNHFYNRLCIIFLKTGKLYQFKSYFSKIKNVCKELQNILQNLENRSKLPYMRYNSDLPLKNHNLIDLPSRKELQIFLQNFLDITKSKSNIKSAQDQSRISRIRAAIKDEIRQIHEKDCESSHLDLLLQEIKNQELKSNEFREIPARTHDSFRIPYYDFIYGMFSPYFIEKSMNILNNMMVFQNNVNDIRNEKYYDEKITFHEYIEDFYSEENFDEKSPNNFLETHMSSVDSFKCNKFFTHFPMNDPVPFKEIEKLQNYLKIREIRQEPIIHLKQKSIEYKKEKGKKVFVFGDTHGNLLNTYLTISKISNNFSSCFQNIMLFNGDYVDRGGMSTEMVVFLTYLALFYNNSDCFDLFKKDSFESYLLYGTHFTFKVNQVILNRGNHEFKTVNSRYGLKDELKSKYLNFHNILYLKINNTFESLQICSKIFHVFTVHGGACPLLTSMYDKSSENNSKMKNNPEDETDHSKDENIPNILTWKQQLNNFNRKTSKFRSKFTKQNAIDTKLVKQLEILKANIENLDDEPDETEASSTSEPDEIVDQNDYLSYYERKREETKLERLENTFTLKKKLKKLYVQFYGFEKFKIKPTGNIKL
ncbi:phosphoprotein phosphatase, partial [Pseudoloma neurophilia]